MAQLKDLVVNGSTRLVGPAYINIEQLTTLNAPTSAGGTTYGPGTNGQVLKSNGSSIYWATANAGTVTSVATGVGLTGGTITGSGTIKAKLRSETALTLDSSAATATTGRVYPVAPDKTGYLAVVVPWTDTTYESKAAASGGTDVSLVTTGEKYTWNSKTSNTGTVTNVATGAGLTGGAITTTGTIKANLRSETKLTNDSAAATETAGRVYPVALDKTGYLAVNVPWTDTTYESKAAASGGTAVSLVTTGEKYTWNNKTSNTGTVTSVATGVGLTGGTITESGTLKANLRSETALAYNSVNSTATSDRVYAVVPDQSGYLSVVVPWSSTPSDMDCGTY